MPAFPFYKLSPSGNTTLFLLAPIGPDAGEYCRQALGPEGIGAEQCGIADLDDRRLQMGGGEFCANACRAFGALMAACHKISMTGEQASFDMEISGSPAPVHLTVRGQAPLWEVSATFLVQDFFIEPVAPGRLMTRLPGISHLLLADVWPEAAALPALASESRQLYDLGVSPANGVVWWREKDGILEILPHVEVPSAGTSMLESSCGSASLALALALQASTGKKSFLIRQPCASLLSINLGKDHTAALSGEVRLCASGEIHLPFPGKP